MAHASLRSALSGLLLACVCFALSARAQDSGGEALMLKLRDGSFRFGAISAHDPEGLVFVRLDNGGMARLSWSALDPAQEAELKTRFGYVDLAGEEVTVQAQRLVTIDGQEIVGLILERGADNLVLKVAGSTITVPKNRLLGSAAEVQVPARLVYTVDELYARELAQQPPADAAGHYEVARYCERILDFAHAVEHYQKALALDPQFHPDDVRAALTRTAEKAKNAAQLEYLEEIDTLIARRKYDEALARADAFAERFPDSAFLSEAKKKHDRVLKARDAYLVELVRQRWIERAGHLARNASTKFTFEQTLAYLEGQMKTELLAAVSKDVQAFTKQVDPDAVRKLFTQRKKVRWERASYGLGTWLLGKERALKGEEPEKPKDKAGEPQTLADKQRKALNEQMQRFLGNREMTARAKLDVNEAEDREQFWKEFNSAGRAQWILAYFAEYGGDFEVNPRPLLDNCKECGGTGLRVISLAGANVAQTQGNRPSGTEEKRNCEACHGLGRVRRILFR